MQNSEHLHWAVSTEHWQQLTEIWGTEQRLLTHNLNESWRQVIVLLNCVRFKVGRVGYSYTSLGVGIALVRSVDQYAMRALTIQLAEKRERDQIIGQRPTIH